MGPPAGVAILWDFVDAVCLCARSSHESVPAGARILVDLILFLAFAAMSSVLAFTVSKLSDSGFYFAFFHDGVGAEYLYIALIFGFLAAIVHLTILVMACYESKRRPTTSTAPQIVYVEVNPDGSVIPVGQQPQLAFSREEPPPSYSPPTDSPSRLLDQIEASELPTTAAVQEKERIGRSRPKYPGRPGEYIVYKKKS
ncbi:hypothetical protein AK830_g1666 [Neonectria ditissima]|uniref:MARVEL domain-containing protein n=1 Tax=Neonectria ditissima TaxID=78410 RepID=A0A0P7BU94_9HYPO|nr:hypothetical protein AK830_g1666 [Neonectria ditissima]